MNHKRKNILLIKGECNVLSRLNTFWLKIAAVIILSFLNIAYSQNYKIEHLSTKDGLSSGCIQSIMQDSKGFMWFATEGGLNRYDGYNIKSYDCKEKYIRTVFEDPADSGKFLWIGTLTGGLFKFNRANETFLQYKNDPNDPYSISGNDVHSIHKDKSGNYWTGTNDGGLDRFDQKTGRFISYRRNPNDSSSISSDSIENIYEDYLGYLWIGTTTGGINKFDRQTNKFTHYYSLFNLAAALNKIFSIFEDSDHILWVGTGWALFKYDRSNDRFIRHELSSNGTPTDGQIFSITEDKENNLWVASNTLGIIRISKDRKTHRYFAGEISSSNMTSCLYIDRTGVIWSGTVCGGINKIIPQKKRFNYFSSIPSSPSNKTTWRYSKELSWVFSFYEDSRGDIWIGTEEGVKKLKNGKLIHYPVIGGTINVNNSRVDIEAVIARFYPSKKGKFWLICRWALIDFDPVTEKYSTYWGKYLIDPSPVINLLIRLLRNNQEIAGIKKAADNKDLTKEFIVDKPGNVLVISTGEGNLNELYDYGWITKKDGKDTIWKMSPESTKCFGGSFKNRNQISVLKLYPGRYYLHYHSDNKPVYNKWTDKASFIPELQGISVFSLSDTDHKKYKDAVKNGNYINLNFYDFTYFEEDNEGKLWAVLKTEENTLHIFDEIQKQFIPFLIKADEKTFPGIRQVIKGRSGALWFCSTDNVLIRRSIEGKFEIKFVLKDLAENKYIKLNENAISQIYEDSHDNLWIGTDIGLFRYNLRSGKTDRYKYKFLLPPNQVMAITEDNRGQLWISSGGNLVKFDPERKVFRKYDTRDGLPDIRFDFNSCCKFKDGRLAFGGSKGFVMFDPDSIKDNDIPPALVISDFQIFNVPVKSGKDSPLKKAVSETEQITLDYSQDVFTLEFAALDYTDPAYNKYAYKMEGVNPDWVDADASHRFATYTKLSPGKYIFRVKGANSDGIWNEAGISILVIISPPWWRTIWAYGLYFILVFSIIYFTWKMQMKRIKAKHEFEMSKFEAEKLREIDEMKSRFFANISHEFRTPLTLILGPVKQMIDAEEDEKVKNELKVVHRNASRLLTLVNQLLDISKLESGEMKLQTSLQDIIPLLKALFKSFMSYAERKRITLNFISAEDEIMVYMDKDKIEKIITNILSNAFKFTPEGGKVEVKVEVEAEAEKKKRYLKVVISDTGIGIPYDKISMIFNRFYQVDGSHTREQEGTGIGLSLTKELVELHKGKIEIESQEGKGTIFRVFIPLGKQHLKPEEICEAKVEAEVKVKVEAEVEGEEKNVGERIGEGGTGNEKPVLLIVEDNADVRNYLRNNLDKDFRILEAVDGEDGLERAIEKMPDLIISDVMMPKMDGVKLCDKIKTDERTSHIPVILLTAKASSQDKIEGFETGADDYIMKPFETEELKARIKNLIEQRKRIHEHFRHHGLFEIEEAKITPVDQKFMQKAMEVIAEHISDDLFGVEQFAEIMSVSRSLLIKKIEALTGEAPSELVKRTRLNKAAKLIESRFGNISQVSLEVGFNNPSYFAECFRKQFGFSPSKYLRDHSKEDTKK